MAPLCPFCRPFHHITSLGLALLAASHLARLCLRLEALLHELGRVDVAEGTVLEAILLGAGQTLARAPHALLPAALRELVDKLVQDSFLLLLLRRSHAPPTAAPEVRQIVGRSSAQARRGIGGRGGDG